MSESIPADETPNQKQARLRRERRNAKIAAGGSDRLAKITSMSGRPAPALEDTPAKAITSAKPSQALKPTISHESDPDEVDISQHHYTPRTTSRPLTPSGRSSPFPPTFGANANANDDPQMRMLQQLLGGFDPNASGAPGAGDDPMAGLPPGMAQMMAAMTGGGMPGKPGAQDATPAPSTTYVWRIVHAVFAFILAAYIAGQTTFTGDRSGRQSVLGMDGAALDDVGKRLFWLFASAEVGLQSTRYFLERGALPQSGMLGMLSNMLPAPFGGYVRVVGRYSVINTTVVADAMVVVFVLGVVSWWRGGVA